MRRIAGLTQVADDAVGLDVDIHPDGEHRRAGNERQADKPVLRIIVGERNEEDPAALHQRVERVEQRTHQHDGPRHPAMPAQLPREDEGAVEIMQLEQQQEHQPDEVAAPVRQQPERQHHDEHRHLHQEPAPMVVERRPPVGLVELAVTRVDKIQRHENHHGHQGHDDEENIECVSGYHQTCLLIAHIPSGRCRPIAYCLGRPRKRRSYPP